MKEISENRIREMATEYGIFEDQGRNPGYYLFTDGIRAAIKELGEQPQGTFYVEVDASEELPESNLVHVIVDTKYRNRDVAVYEPSEGVWINMDGSLIEVKSWLKKVTNDSVGASLKHHSDMIELLAEYTDFLLKEGYCDTDVYSEPPTAIDQFMKTKL